MANLGRIERDNDALYYLPSKAIHNRSINLEYYAEQGKTNDAEANAHKLEEPIDSVSIPTDVPAFLRRTQLISPYKRERIMANTY